MRDAARSFFQLLLIMASVGLGAGLGAWLKDYFFRGDARGAAVVNIVVKSESELPGALPVSRPVSSAPSMTIGDINNEMAKPWHADEDYMVKMWFGGRSEQLSEIRSIINRDSAELARPNSISRLRAEYERADSDDKKRELYHQITYSRIYNMLLVLELAKQRDMLARADRPAATNSVKNVQDDESHAGRRVDPPPPKLFQ